MVNDRRRGAQAISNGLPGFWCWLNERTLSEGGGAREKDRPCVCALALVGTHLNTHDSSFTL